MESGFGDQDRRDPEFYEHHYLTTYEMKILALMNIWLVGHAVLNVVCMEFDLKGIIKVMCSVAK